MSEQIEVGSRLQNESDGYLQEHLRGCTTSIEVAKKDIERWEDFKKRIEAEIERRKNQ